MERQPLTLEEVQARIAKRRASMTLEEREARRQAMICPEHLRRRTPSKRALLEALAKLTDEEKERV